MCPHDSGENAYDGPHNYAGVQTHTHTQAHTHTHTLLQTESDEKIPNYLELKDCEFVQSLA